MISEKTINSRIPAMLQSTDYQELKKIYSNYSDKALLKDPIVTNCGHRYHAEIAKIIFGIMENSTFQPTPNQMPCQSCNKKITYYAPDPFSKKVVRFILQLEEDKDLEAFERLRDQFIQKNELTPLIDYIREPQVTNCGHVYSKTECYFSFGKTEDCENKENCYTCKKLVEKYIPDEITTKAITLLKQIRESLISKTNPYEVKVHHAKNPSSTEKREPEPKLSVSSNEISTPVLPGIKDAPPVTIGDVPVTSEFDENEILEAK